MFKENQKANWEAGRSKPPLELFDEAEAKVLQSRFVLVKNS
ncbi:hypothetical protein STRDD11_02272 [Streptococcus sp. DD11]|nr:hypothetical protein [Streptococcus sp. DD11]KXT79439.1 hypothetical protein STRDD11_02272 [Streptococcus sp. DD11]